MRAATLLVTAATLWAGLARPQPARADGQIRAALTWQAPPSCIDANTLEAAVERALGRPVFSGAPDVAIEGHVAFEGDGIVAHLAMTALGGQPLGARTLHGPRDRCRDIDGDLTIVVALMVDVREEEIAVYLPERRAPAVAPPAPTVPRATPSVSTSTSWQWRIAASVLGTYALLPGTSGGASVGAEVVVVRHLQLGAQATYLFPASADHDGGGVTLYGLSAGPWACWVVRVGPVDLGPCLLASAGGVHFRSFGLSRGDSGWRPLAIAGAELGAAVRVGAGELRLRLGAAAPLWRDRFVYTDSGAQPSLHRAAPVVPLLEIGLVVPLGS